MAKKKESKQKKMNVRVDFTPMVDMMMLLITFFMLCTSLAKPQAMHLTMPANDKNLTDADKDKSKTEQTITIYLTGEDKVYVYMIEHKEDFGNLELLPKQFKETTWGKNGIRKVLQTHVTEDNTQPVLQVMKAKAELDLQKETLEDSVYKKELSKIKSGELPSGKIQTMTIIIKATDKSTYKNVVDALDEMQICSIGKYVLDKINEQDEKLLKEKGIE